MRPSSKQTEPRAFCPCDEETVDLPVSLPSRQLEVLLGMQFKCTTTWGTNGIAGEKAGGADAWAESPGEERDDLSDDRHPHDHEQRAEVVGRGLWAREAPDEGTHHRHDEEYDDDEEAT